MNWNKAWLTGVLFIIIPAMAYAADLPTGGRQRSGLGDGHKSTFGVVTKVTDDMISVALATGTTRRFSVKDTKREGISDCKPGERVLLELDEGNQIIDINDLGAMHHLVRGTVGSIDPINRIVTLTLRDGTSRSYRMKDAVAAKMNLVAAGADVTVMTDHHNGYAMAVEVE
jgi:hypothetical protein